MPDRPRVLVTDAEVRKTVAVVRGLVDRFEVWTTSTERPAMAAWCRGVRQHLRMPANADHSDWLLNTCRKHRVDALICPQETSLANACSVYDDLEANGTRPTFPKLDVLDLAFDKAKTLEIARSLNLPAPATAAPQEYSEVADAAERLGFPVVVKPRYSNYWSEGSWVPNAGTEYANDREQLGRVLDSFDKRQPPPLLQEFVPGRGLGVFVMLDRKGRDLATFAHRRLRDVRPTGSGSVLRRGVKPDPKTLERSLALLRHMRLWGVSMVEFKTDRASGETLLMEVNGRFWGSLQLALDSNLNFPALLVDMALDKSPKTQAFVEGAVVRWWLGDLLRLVRVLKGKPTSFPGSFPKRGAALRSFFGRQPAGTRNELVRREDPWPGLAEWIASLKRLF